MGLRFRKSINLGGGVRVNISKSGVGYSFGTKGYRVTRTAKGKTRQTFSIPGTGISYTTESGRKKKKGKAKIRANVTVEEAGYGGAQPSLTEVEQVTTTNVHALRSTAYEELCKRIQILRVLHFLLAFLALLFLSDYPVIGTLFLVGFLCFHFFAHCSIGYEFDAAKDEEWNRMRAAWERASESDRVLQVVMTAKSVRAKEATGVESAIDAKKVSVGSRLPWYLRASVKPIVFHLKGCKMAILPDRLFLYNWKSFGVISYQDASFGFGQSGIVDDGKPPKDAKVDKKMWLYANADGSRDMRHKDNRQLNAVSYGEVAITSQSGLNVILLFSNEGAVRELEGVMGKVALEMPAQEKA